MMSTKIQMSKIGILVTIVAVTLVTGLLVGSLPITDAQVAGKCPPSGKFVDVKIDGVDMGPFEIDSYTTSTEVDKMKKKNMFMFTHEVDGVLSGKMLDALNNGDVVDFHITTCKEIGAGVFKIHTVWLTGGTVTSVTETSGDDDDFPKEKIKGTFEEIERVTETPDGD